MSKKNHMSRRDMMAGMGALVASPRLISSQDITFKNYKIDLNDPVQNALAYTKLIGTTARSMVHIYYKGTIFGMTPEEGVKPMIGHTGVLKGVWKPWVDNSF